VFELVQSTLKAADAKSLAAGLEASVRQGGLAPGTRVPTVRALAARLGLSPTTVAAAYRALRQRGILKGVGRQGTRVTLRPPLAVPRPDVVVPAGLRDLAFGNPDPALLPALGPALRRLAPKPLLYGLPPVSPELLIIARRELGRDGVPAHHLTVVGGALDGIERVLQAHLQPGDRVAVEDPGYTSVLDLLGALGLAAEPVALDDTGLRPASLREALRRGARACVLTPRAQNPTGAALTPERARELAAVFAKHPDVLVIEDDHAGPVAGAAAATTAASSRSWAVVRSVSKWLGPDLRLAFLAGDETTVARVEGRQSLGCGWVSHVLQELVVHLYKEPGSARRLREAARLYAERRETLVRALRRHGLPVSGRSGFNVWIPVAEEAAVVAALGARGWAVRAGEAYRLASPPAIRVTTADLRLEDAERLAADIAAVLRPRSRVAVA
jgi:DNA-binding transcriptional MocR family regulator